MGRRRRSFNDARARVSSLQGALADEQQGGADPAKVEALSRALESATQQLDSFKKQADESAKSWARSFAGMTGVASLMHGAENAVANLGNTILPGNLQGLAGGMSSGLGSGIGAIREGLGNIDAAGSAAARLGGMGAHFAREGMPLDPDLMRQIAPIIEGQEREAQKAQRFANDLVGDRTSRELGDAMYDAYTQIRRMLGVDAAKQRR